VKWFQLDADTPDDPKIRAVTRELGAAGLGGLVGVWCHIAKHGRNAGQGIDSRGVPLPVDDLVAASLLDAPTFDALVAVCTRTGHFRRDVWERYRGIWIPAMERRADRYTQRLARQRTTPLGWTSPEET